MSGGARPRSGPRADPGSLRQYDRGAEWTRLPREGRDGPTPVWPLTRKPRGWQVLWEAEWKRPQAIMWERLGQEMTVALMVVSLLAAEGPKARSGDRTTSKQLMDALGITLSGMNQLRWTFDDLVDAPAVSPAIEPETAAPVSARDRLLRIVPQSA